MNCVKCGKRSRQYYNGLCYCINHHPHAVCPRCGGQAGKFLRPSEWCKACQRWALDCQLPLLPPVSNRGVTQEENTQNPSHEVRP
jgi:hypothetical protein